MVSLSCIQQNDSTEANIDNKVATTDLKIIFIFESVFSFVRTRKLSGWEKVEALRQIHLFPIQVWRQVHINDSREETSAVAKAFWSEVAKRKIQSTLITNELRHVAAAAGEARAYSDATFA